MSDWVAKITKQFCNGGKIKYQVGYQPNPDPCTALATATNTTTTSGALERAARAPGADRAAAARLPVGP